MRFHIEHFVQWIVQLNNIYITSSLLLKTVFQMKNQLMEKGENGPTYLMKGKLNK